MGAVGECFHHLSEELDEHKGMYQGLSGSIESQNGNGDRTFFKLGQLLWSAICTVEGNSANLDHIFKIEDWIFSKFVRYTLSYETFKSY